MSLPIAIWDDPRIPPDAYRNGHRVRDMQLDELRARGFSEAEAWSIRYAQYQTIRSPLHYVNDNVLHAKLEDGLPLLAHERREARKRILRTWERRLVSMGEDRFRNMYGGARLEATKLGTLCEADLEGTAR